jgi:hypothetical protein
MITAHTIKSLARHAGELTTALMLTGMLASFVRRLDFETVDEQSVTARAAACLPAPVAPTSSASHVDMNMVAEFSCSKLPPLAYCTRTPQACPTQPFVTAACSLVLAWCRPTRCDQLLCSCVAGSVWPRQSTLCLRVRRAGLARSAHVQSRHRAVFRAARPRYLAVAAGMS